MASGFQSDSPEATNKEGGLHHAVGGLLCDGLEKFLFGGHGNHTTLIQPLPGAPPGGV